MQQPDTDVLAVLLQQQFHQDTNDAAAIPVYALLSASQATAGLVHSICSARLHAHMPRSPAAASDRALAPGLCRWLAKHARLLRALTLTVSPYEELAVAAGLHAATTPPEQQPEQLQPPQQQARVGGYGTMLAAAAGPAAVMDAAGLAQHARQAAAKSPSAPAAAGGPLPLAELHCCSPIEGRLLQSLAGAQLTSLRLTLQTINSPRAALIAGLAALISLRVLDLAAQGAAGPAQNGGQPAAAAAGGTALVAPLSPALGALTQLTQLSLSGWVLLSQGDVKHVPRSLLRLAIGRRMSTSGGRALVPEPDDAEFPPHEPLSVPHAPLDLSGLTRLTCLEVSEVCPRDKLPGSLLELHISKACSLKPINTKGKHQLASLRLLAIEGGLKALARLPASVTELRLGIANPYGADGMGGGEFLPWPCQILDAEAATLTRRIKPLRQLHLTDFMLQPSLLSKLGSCTQLTSLEFRRCNLVRPGEDLCQVYWPSKRMVVQHIQGFAAQLRKLQQLQHLVLELIGPVIEIDGYDDDEEEANDADEARHFYGKDAVLGGGAAMAGASDDEQGGGGRGHTLGALELQPLVDAIASLRGLTSLLVAWTEPSCAVLIAEQLATLAAVAPSP